MMRSSIEFMLLIILYIDLAHCEIEATLDLEICLMSLNDYI